MNVKLPISARLIDDACNALNVWDFGNDVLYALCREHPKHIEHGKIVAKVWLIGRSYAAAIERRRPQGNYVGDEYYEKCVAPIMKGSEIDIWFQNILDDKTNDTELSLQVHRYLTDLFKRISHQDKRSLASKYLHFHFPERFFIFDSRANKAIRSLVAVPKAPNSPFNKSDQQDSEYASFFRRCKALTECFAQQGRKVSPRELDKVLLWVSRPSVLQQKV